MEGKTCCITVVVQFPKEGVHFEEMAEKLRDLIEDGTNAEMVFSWASISVAEFDSLLSAQQEENRLIQSQSKKHAT